MLKKKALYYWCCQIAGWGFLFAVLWMTAPGNWRRSAIVVGVGLVVSHGLRLLAVRVGWMRLPVGRVWWRMLMGVVLASVVAGWTRGFVEEYLLGHYFGSPAVGSVDYLLLFFPWAGLYCIVHYVGMLNENAVRVRRLEMRLAEMQKEAEELGIDDRTIIERLKRIEGMIESDPARSREEITEFSKLLRRGYVG